MSQPAKTTEQKTELAGDAVAHGDEAAAPPKPSKIKLLIVSAKNLWNPPREVLLVRALVLICVLTVGSMGTATYLFLKIIHPHSAELKVAHHSTHAEKEKPEGGGEHGGAEAGHGGGGHEGGGEGVVLGGPSLPESILEAQDGVMESGHDLIEPEIENTRNLASLIKGEDIKVHLGSRFIEMPEVFTSLREGKLMDGMLTVNISLEVQSSEAQAEVTRRSTEIQSLIASLATERQKSVMMSTKGMLSFKEDVHREINLMIGAGKVTDVLLTNFNVR